MERTPAQGDWLYFVGTCTDLPSYQEALDCARAEALTDVTAWVGARISSYVYSRASEGGRASHSTVYLDGTLFLADARRDDTYYEIREEEWGRSYLVSILIGYPRSQAEAERARIEDATRDAARLMDDAPSRIATLAADRRWGDAMDFLIEAATRVAVARNVQRDGQIQRLAHLARDLVAPLEISAAGEGSTVAVTAVYRGSPAVGVPVQCLSSGREVSEVTDGDGGLVCETVPLEPGEAGRVTVRPDISGYLNALPDGANSLAEQLGALLDRSVSVTVGQRLTLRVALSGGGGCESSLRVVETNLNAAGVTVTDEGASSLTLEVSCRIEDEDRTGDLFTASAEARLSLQSEDERAEGHRAGTRGVGSTRAAAREEAAVRLGRELSDAALLLLREYKAKNESGGGA